MSLLLPPLVRVSSETVAMATLESDMTSGSVVVDCRATEAGMSRCARTQ
jgi:hypothetical protein